MIVVRAILWSNGMVMAFDESGQQVPDYQGRGAEVIPRLRRKYPDLKIEGMDWQTDVRDPETARWKSIATGK